MKQRWRVGERKDQHNHTEITIESVTHQASVATVIGSTNPMMDWWAGARFLRGNAELIAAAPELRDLLEELIESAFGGDMLARPTMDVWRDAKVLLDKLKGYESC